MCIYNKHLNISSTDKTYCVQGTIIYVNANWTYVLSCPFKADTGSRLDWFGPPNLMTYTLGRDINPNLPHSDRISAVGKIEEGEYNLRISNIQRSDRGDYQCAGRVNGNTATGLVELFFAVPPETGPSLSRNPPGLIFVGNTILLKCEVSGGTPLANISWQCDDLFGEHTASTDTKIEATINLTLKESDNNKKCTCRANHPSWTSQESVDIFLNVFYRSSENNQTHSEKVSTNTSDIMHPSEASVTGNIEIIESPNIELCSIDTGNELSLSSNFVTSRIANDVNKSKHGLSVDRIEKNKCPVEEENILSKFTINQTNNSVAPDRNLTIQRTPAGGIISGNKVNLTCIASGGNPPATLAWNCFGTNTNYTIGNTVSYSVEFEVDTSDNNKLCTCSATHPVNSYSPQAHNRLIVYYVPGTNPIILQNPPGAILTGNNVKLTCTVLGGNPLAILLWNCTGTEENNTAGNTASYSITMSVNKSYNNKICTCTAHHLISTYKPTVQQNLVVYYAPSDLPSIQQTPAAGIINGHTVVLTCSVKGGNPPPILRWNCTGDMTNSTTDTTATYSVSFPVNKSQNKAICACSASHPDLSYTHVIEHSLDVYCKYHTFCEYLLYTISYKFVDKRNY
ncbi:unnamed protein product [Mytilus coruscus]|uniref:Ig-like domain-containing protein n=1 Tax=Mytilus coruscus TaxID=42192 RepID=A0A6J8BLY4_MYTCO|nr:unnamed protein product [Mytilus coruscus]